METTEKNWGRIALHILKMVALQLFLGSFLGLFTGIFAGVICGSIYAVWDTSHIASGLFGLIFGAYLGAPIGAVSGAVAFAIQGLVVALSSPARCAEKWQLSRHFLLPTTVIFSIGGGLSIGVLYFLWLMFFRKNVFPNPFREANNGFFYGSIVSYCIGTLVASLAPERLEKVQAAWRQWRTAKDIA